MDFSLTSSDGDPDALLRLPPSVSGPCRWKNLRARRLGGHGRRVWLRARRLRSEDRPAEGRDSRRGVVRRPAPVLAGRSHRGERGAARLRPPQPSAPRRHRDDTGELRRGDGRRPLRERAALHGDGPVLPAGRGLHAADRGERAVPGGAPRRRLVRNPRVLRLHGELLAGVRRPDLAGAWRHRRRRHRHRGRSQARQLRESGLPAGLRPDRRRRRPAALSGRGRGEHSDLRDPRHRLRRRRRRRHHRGAAADDAPLFLRAGARSGVRPRAGRSRRAPSSSLRTWPATERRRHRGRGRGPTPISSRSWTIPQDISVFAPPATPTPESLDHFESAFPHLRLAWGVPDVEMPVATAAPLRDADRALRSSRGAGLLVFEDAALDTATQTYVAASGSPKAAACRSYGQRSSSSASPIRARRARRRPS